MHSTRRRRLTAVLVALAALAVGALVFGAWFPVLTRAQKGDPDRATKKEEQEEGDETPQKPTKGKVPKREEMEEDDPKPDAGQPVNLAYEAKHSTGDIHELFALLVTPHDELISSGLVPVHHDVEPLAIFVGTDPTFSGKLKPRPIKKNGKREAMVAMAAKNIKAVVPYEEIALKAVAKLLAKSDESRVVAAEKALRAVLRFHLTQRQRRSQDAAAWSGVELQLRSELLKVQRQRVNLLAGAKHWPEAFRLAEQLARDHPQDADLQIDLARLALRQAQETDKIEDYVAARRRLNGVESQLGLGTKIEAVRKGLIAKAQRLLAEGLELVDKDRSAAIERLRNASLIWPQLPDLQDKLLELDREHPVLRVGVRNLPVYLSPATAWTDTEKQAVELLFEGLVKASFEADGTWHFRPGLTAGRPRVIPQGREFDLASDAFWSDGKHPVAAADIRHTINLLKQPTLPGRNSAWARLVEDARVEGTPYQVRITLRSGFLDPVSLMTFKVLPRQFQGQTLREADDEAFAKNPLGSGPFQMQRAGTQGDSPPVVFVANPFYERSGKPGRPRIREIRFVVPKDRVMEFKNGQLHLLLDLSTKEVVELTKAGVHPEDIHTLANRRVFFLAVNHDNEALQNQDLRQAIAHAINREAILRDHFRAGFQAIDRQNRLVAKPSDETQPLHPALNGPYPLDSWACAPASRVPRNLYDFDLAKTKARLARRGTVELTLSFPNDDPRVVKACEAICAQVGRLGSIKMTPRALPPRDFREALMRRRYDLAYCHYDYDSEAYWLWPLFDPEQSARDKGGPNYLGYRNDADLARFFRLAMSYRRFDEVRKVTHDIHALLNEKMPLIPLWQLHTHLAIHPDLTTVGLDPLRVFTNAEEWRFEKK